MTTGSELATSVTLDKSAIKSMVLAVRKNLENDLTVILRQYGLHAADRDWRPLTDLNPDYQPLRRRLEAAMQPELARIKLNQSNPTRANQAAAGWYIREVAFTYLNRLVGLKCLETRGLFPEVIQVRSQYSGRSLYHRDFLARHPDLLGRADDALPAMLQAACLDVTAQIRYLFDPTSDSSIIWPRYAALKDCIERINQLPEDYWRQDEIIGWIYQFYNAEEKPEIRKRTPTLPIEIAVINQFFTPRWIVKFLVDNTLGRLWLEMHPDSPRVRAKCDYLVPEMTEIEAAADQPADPSATPKEKAYRLDPTSPINNPRAAARRTAKPPRAIRLIDPACGAMHFGHYAFEVFEAIYRDARDLGFGEVEDHLPDQAIPLAILQNNLFGVDIDLRAVQLAALALYLKARVALQAAGVGSAEAAALPWQVNLVCADARLPAGPKREEFLAEYEDDKTLQDAWRELFKEMEDIAQVGSLLRVEQRFRNLLAAHKPASVIAEGNGQLTMPAFEPPARQLSFAEAPQNQGWSPHRSLETMLDHLRAFARAALESADVNAQLFATEAEKTLGLLDVLMQEYDVAVMNPPYGDPLEQTRKLLKKQYPQTAINLYAMFLDRALQLTENRGYVGALVSRTFLTLDQFDDTRNLILDKSRVVTLYDIGPSVLDDATVDTASLVLGASNNTKNGTFGIFFKSDAVIENYRNVLVEAISNLWSINLTKETYIVDIKNFVKIPGARFLYSAPASVINLFSSSGKFEPDYGQPRAGMLSGDDETFTRKHWEVLSSSIGDKWFGFAKGGSYNRYYYDLDLVLNWKDNGKDIRQFISQKQSSVSRWIFNEAFYFREGITYPNSSSRGFSARYLPKNHIFSVKGQGLFTNDNEDIWWVLAILNSAFVDYILYLLSPGKDFQAGQIKVLPSKPLAQSLKEVITEKAKTIYKIKSGWDTGNEICTRFDKPWLLKVEELLTGEGLEAALGELERQESQSDARLQAIQAEIDREVYQLYEIGQEDQQLIERELGKRPPELVWPQLEGKSREEKRKEHVRRLLSYFVLKALKADNDGIILLVEGGGERSVLTALRTELESYFGEKLALRLEDEAVRVLKKPLADWLAGEFVKWHTALYKNRPVVWQLASDQGTFSALLYYHKLDSDILLKIRKYLKTMADRVEAESRAATIKEDWKAVARHEAVADELRVFDEKLAALTVEGYRPVIDNGVKKNIEPLQKAGLLKMKAI